MKRFLIFLIFLILLPLDAFALHTMTSDNTNATYCYVVGDGYSLRFDKTTYMLNYAQIREGANGSLIRFNTLSLHNGADPFSIGYGDRTLTVTETNDSRVVITMVGGLYDSSQNQLSTHVVTEIYTCYPDRFTYWLSIDVVTSDIVITSNSVYNRMGGILAAQAAITGEAVIYEGSGSESTASDDTDYNTADYLAITSDECNFLISNLLCDGTLQLRYDLSGINMILNVRMSGTLTAGITYDHVNVIWVDHEDRDDTQLYDLEADRIIIGNQNADDSI